MPELMGKFFAEVHRRWVGDNTFLLAAYVLWRLAWIHPFADGNGRTARAAAYLVICLKDGRWYPGRKTLLLLLRENEAAYIDALRHADDSFMDDGDEALIPLAKLLANMLRQQLILAAAERAGQSS